MTQIWIEVHTPDFRQGYSRALQSQDGHTVREDEIVAAVKSIASLYSVGSISEAHLRRLCGELVGMVASAISVSPNPTP